MGRKRIGKHKTYRISDSDYEAFPEWCHSNGQTVNETIRGLIYHATVRGLIEDEELERLARKILTEKERK